jgi:hypothetical protein
VHTCTPAEPQTIPPSANAIFGAATRKAKKAKIENERNLLIFNPLHFKTLYVGAQFIEPVFYGFDKSNPYIFKRKLKFAATKCDL